MVKSKRVLAWAALSAVVAASGRVNASTDVLSYWNFNNAINTDGFGELLTTGTVEVYDGGTKLLAPASQGVFASTSLVNLNNVIGTNGTAAAPSTSGDWGTFAGATNNVIVPDGAGQALTIVGSANNSSFLTFVTSATGYKNLVLTYDSRGTGTGFTTHTWSASADGAIFTAIPDITGRNVTTFSTLTADFSSITGLENATSVFFKVVVAGATGNTGNNRFDNIQIRGITLATSVLTWNPGATTWNGTNANWFNGTSNVAYADSDQVQFTDSGLANGSNVAIVGSGVTPGSVAFSHTSGTYTFTGGPINDATAGPTAVTLSGGGTVVLSNTANGFSGGLNLQAGKLQSATDSNLGTGLVTLSGGATLAFSPALPNVTRNLTLTGLGGTIDNGNADWTYSGILSGGGQLTKTGSGILTIGSVENANLSPAFTGTVNLTAGTLKLNQVGTFGLTGLGSAGINARAGTTLTLENVVVGKLRNTGTNPGFVDLFHNSTLQAVGTGSAYAGGSIFAVFNFDANSSTFSPTNVNIVLTGTGSTPSVLTIRQSFKQFEVGNNYTSYNTTTNSNIAAKLISTHITGGGTLILNDGGVSSRQSYSGDWQIDNGVLQVGPFYANTNWDSAPGDSVYGGPFGQPLNALGFKTPIMSGLANGNPDIPVDAFVNAGGTLAIAVDQVNVNPSITAGPLNDTPAYIRSGVVLNGGKLVATGSEVNFDATVGGLGMGTPNGTAVVARLGGNFTVNSGTVQVYDSIGGTGARTVELVAGSRTLTVASPGYDAGAVITSTTTWNGTLTVDPGPTTGGVFNIARTGGNVVVSPGAKIIVKQGATLALNGVGALSDGTNKVDIENGSTTTLAVQTGSHTVGNVTGTGNTVISASAVLTAKSISQNALTVNGTAVLSANGTANNGSKVNSLTLAGTTGAWTGKVDITDNALVVQSASTTSKAALLSTLVDQITQARNGAWNAGAWDGNGVTSSSIVGNVNAAMALIDNADLPTLTSVDGQSVNSLSVTVTRAIQGDADLSGIVDAADFDVWFKHVGSTTFSYGAADWDMSGIVDAADFDVWFKHVGTSTFNLGGGGGAAAVPEPASLAVLMLGGAALLGRRRKP